MARGGIREVSVGEAFWDGDHVGDVLGEALLREKSFAFRVWGLGMLSLGVLGGRV